MVRGLRLVNVPYEMLAVPRDPETWELDAKGIYRETRYFTTPDAFPTDQGQEIGTSSQVIDKLYDALIEDCVQKLKHGGPPKDKNEFMNYMRRGEPVPKTRPEWMNYFEFVDAIIVNT